MNGNTCSQGRFFYRRRGDLLAASSGTIGLGDDRLDFEIAVGQKSVECGNGKLRRATEDDTHGAHCDCTSRVPTKSSAVKYVCVILSAAKISNLTQLKLQNRRL